MAVRHVVEQLAAGHTVIHKEGGNSMLPIIKSRQPVTLAPVDPTRLWLGDIVLARVRGRLLTHLVHGVRPGEVLIGNNRGHMNGWVKHHNILGIVTHVDGVPRKHAAEKTRSTTQ